MALRITKAELPAEVEEELIRQFGAVPEPFAVTAHNPKVARDSSEMGGKVNEWDMADEGLKTFAHMAVASLVGCGWCLDINYFQALHKDLDLTKASQVPRWRESQVFTPLEREVLEYAEAMTQTPPTVTDAQYASLLDRLGEAALVELTASVAFANLATRNNAAHGITSQGFSDACGIPLSARPDARPHAMTDPRPDTRPDALTAESGAASTA
ncbi:carboxymuconolactone decarboxylase family protein [Streptomyces sp. NPDC060205]|uniref:carboxymuconolactone decarboxylase family protein n=1 Tax=Streptomyces sp. NPDC060205 TaxID=3347072 RepID=UPI003661E2F3